jgi:hypothetical protein
MSEPLSKMNEPHWAAGYSSRVRLPRSRWW